MGYRGGAEFALTGNWTMRGEFLHYRLSDLSATVPGAGPAIVAGGLWTYECGRTSISTARVGLEYKFRGPVIVKGPLVARY